MVFRNIFCHFFESISRFYLDFLKKPPTPSASTVLSLTIIDVFLLHIEHCPNNILFSLPVFFINCCFTNNIFCVRIAFLLNAKNTNFKFLKTHLIVQINCNVKVNVSPLKSILWLLSSSKQKVTVFKTGLFFF